MESLTTNRAKRKEAANAQSRQQPLEIERSPQPKRTQGKSTTGAAELQSKMKEAAEKFVSLTSEFWASLYEPGLRDLSDQARAGYVYGPHVHCTPQEGGTVFLKLGREWIRLTLENLTEAYQNFAGEKTVDVNHKGTMEETLNLVRSVCKEHGKVSWVLPRLGQGVVA